MLDKWLQTLEEEKQKAIILLREVHAEKRIEEGALYEITINYETVKHWLLRMDNKGFTVNDDLSQIDEYYDKLEEYRWHHNHVCNHLWQMRNVPTDVKKDKFLPMFG